MKRLIYLIGEPGSGKSTLMRAMTVGLDPINTRDGVMPIVEHRNRTSGLIEVVEVGQRRDTFSGTDALSMGIMPRAVEWVRTTTHPLVVGEGDRLASPKFWDAARAAGFDVRIVEVSVDPDVAAARRWARGSRQSSTWLRGRRTRVANLAPFVTLTVDGSRPSPEVAEKVWQFA